VRARPGENVVRNERIVAAADRTALCENNDPGTWQGSLMLVAPLVALR
jgi:hypothetical protein